MYLYGDAINSAIALPLNSSGGAGGCVGFGRVGLGHVGLVGVGLVRVGLSRFVLADPPS